MTASSPSADLRHHHRRHRPFGRRGSRLHQCHHRLAAGRRRPGLDRDHPDTPDRRRHRHVPRLRHRPHGPAALHHHARNPHLAARHRPLDHQWFDHLDLERRLHQLRPRRLSRCTQPLLDGHRGGVPAYVFLHLSRWGRYLFAVGSNSEAARLSGVNVNRTIYTAYILSSTCAAFVGILLASRIGIGNATQAEGWELQAIASSVIGGTSLFGAVGSVQGPLLGAFILATINNGANLMNVNSFWQRIITGALIILIVYFDQLRRRGSR